MKILLIACIVWIAIFAVCTTYTVPHNYSDSGAYSVCNSVVNTCFGIDGLSIVKMEG